MHLNYQKMAIVIPTLEPTVSLISYVHNLQNHGFFNIIIVNDGSSPEYDKTFQEISRFDGCKVISYAKNRGKGHALKTGYLYISNHLEHCTHTITVDSDGQHAVEDVRQLADKLLTTSGTLLLGGRDFSQPDVPFKSRFGNRTSSAMFRLFHGTWLPDTQTGLRGFDASLLPLMLSIEGERFEYEMAVLTTFAQEKRPIQTTTIQTIYLEGNKSTHFRPLADSFQVMSVLLQQLARFALSSGLSFLVDYGLAWVLLTQLTSFVTNDYLRIGISLVVARVVSLLVNYRLNKQFVFQDRTGQVGTFPKYLFLCAINIVLSTFFIEGISTWLNLPEILSKVFCDIPLFALNYYVQKAWIFTATRKEPLP